MAFSTCYARPIAEAETEQQSPHYYSTVTCHADCQVSFGRNNDVNSPNYEATTPKGEAVPNTNDDDSAKWQDLLAQCRMAYWTIWIAGFTGFGVFLLIGTLIEAFIGSRAAWTAVADMRKEKAANLIVNGDVISMGMGPGTSPQYRPSTSINFHNIGGLPAKNVDVEITWILEEGTKIILQETTWGFSEKRLFDIPSNIGNSGGGDPDTDNFPTDPQWIDFISNENYKWRLVMRVSYLNGFRKAEIDTIWKTDRVFTRNYVDPNTGQSTGQLDLVIKLVKTKQTEKQ